MNIQKAHSIHPISVLQSEYSLWERNLEAQIIPLLNNLGIGLVPFSPLGRGFLTGQAKPAQDYPENDYRRNDPRYQGDNFTANMHALTIVNEIAQQQQATPGQIALAWLLHKGLDIVPIPGTKHPHYLEQNIQAVQIILSKEQIQKIDNALPASMISGARYGAQQMQYVDR